MSSFLYKRKLYQSWHKSVKVSKCVTRSEHNESLCQLNLSNRSSLRAPHLRGKNIRGPICGGLNCLDPLFVYHVTMDKDTPNGNSGWQLVQNNTAPATISLFSDVGAYPHPETSVFIWCLILFLCWFIAFAFWSIQTFQDGWYHCSQNKASCYKIVAQNAHMKTLLLLLII